MKQPALPTTDSIQELARFWDTHDLSDFENELEEAPSPVFQRRKVIAVDLEAREAQALSRMASRHGVPEAELVRRWVREKIGAR